MKRIKIDRSKCVGCLTCTTACIVSHSSEDTRSRITIDRNKKYFVDIVINQNVYLHVCQVL